MLVVITVMRVITAAVTLSTLMLAYSVAVVVDSLALGVYVCRRVN